MESGRELAQGVPDQLLAENIDNDWVNRQQSILHG